MRTKPHLKYDKGMGVWLCGGLPVDPWYIDWFSGPTPEIAYNRWKRGAGQNA
jgi:hypothetical protein